VSSKLRTPSDLQDAMSEEFAWRKVELSALKSLVIANQTPRTRDLCQRAAVTILYAHWEGFIKKIGTLYVRFVSDQQLKHSELSPCFMAVAMSSMIQEVGASSKIQPALDLVAFIREKHSTRSNIAWRSAVDTRSNLSSTVLREIVMTLGLDYSRFATKENLLDRTLLDSRNNIAHGKFLTMDTDTYLSLHDDIFGMMQDFYNQVDNAALLNAYRSDAPQN
jgi:hypothetical protein